MTIPPPPDASLQKPPRPPGLDSSAFLPATEPKNDVLDDTAWVERFNQASDQSAFEEIARRHHGRIVAGGAASAASLHLPEFAKTSSLRSTLPSKTTIHEVDPLRPSHPEPRNKPHQGGGEPGAATAGRTVPTHSLFVWPRRPAVTEGCA